MTKEKFRKINVEMLCPYEPGKPISEVKRELGLETVHKLASNENPLGPSEHVLQTLRDTNMYLSEYPDTNGYFLRRRISRHLDVPEDEILLGNGSADLMKLVADAFLSPGLEAVMPDPSFPVYEMVTRIAGAKPVIVPTTEDFQIDLAEMSAAVTPKTRVLWLANPNNPTGRVLPASEVESFLDDLPEHVIAVIDVAYEHYARDESYGPQLLRTLLRERTIVLKTFSKAAGLAGLRCGAGIARRQLIEMMEKVRIPFSVNTAAQVAAMASLESQGHITSAAELNAAELARYYRACDRLRLSYVPSDANFVLVDVGQDAAEVAQRMLHEGVIVRFLPHPRLMTMLRITTGTAEQDEACLEALTRAL